MILKGLVIIHKLFVTAASLTAAYAAYTVLPTVLLRKTSYGIVQKTNMPGVLLTFDDGPNPQYTPQLLDLLKQYDVKAIFFLVAQKAEQYPDIVKRIQREGHVIGIHHYTHRSSFNMTPSMLFHELEHARDVLEHLTHEPITLYRPTYGFMNLATLPIAKKLGLTTMLWTAIPGDWKIKQCQTTLPAKLAQAVEDGATIVLHDCGKNRGADDAAPAYMLHVLAVFLQQSKRTQQVFTNPHDWLASYER